MTRTKKTTTSRSRRRRSRNPTLPELEQARSAVLNSLGSPQSQRTYGRAMEEFIVWVLLRAPTRSRSIRRSALSTPTRERPPGTGDDQRASCRRAAAGD